MTTTAASARETPVAVLFGTAQEPPQVAAERALDPHLRSNLGVLAPLPETIRNAAVGAIVTAVLVLLDFNLIELLVDGWREHHDLTDAARRTLAKLGTTELVALATHRITVSQQPSIDVLLNGERVTTVNLEFTLQFDISAAVAGVGAGMMTALHAGRCDITATVTIQGAEAIARQKRIDLPGVISLEQGIRLLHEQDYVQARQARAAAEGRLAAAGSSEPETVRMAAISSKGTISGEEESAATQPA